MCGIWAATVHSGKAPYGVAVVTSKENDTVVSEVAVPAPPDTHNDPRVCRLSSRQPTGEVQYRHCCGSDVEKPYPRWVVISSIRSKRVRRTLMRRSRGRNNKT